MRTTGVRGCGGFYAPAPPHGNLPAARRGCPSTGDLPRPMSFSVSVDARQTTNTTCSGDARNPKNGPLSGGGGAPADARCSWTSGDGVRWMAKHLLPLASQPRRAASSRRRILPPIPNPSDEASAPPRRSRIGDCVRGGRAAGDDDCASRPRRGIARAAAHPPRPGASGCSRHGCGCERARDRISRKRARRDVLARIGGFGDRAGGGRGGDREDVARPTARPPARSRADGHGAGAGGCAVRSVPACGRSSVRIFPCGGAAGRIASIAWRVVCLLRASGARANGLRVKEDGRTDAAHLPDPLPNRVA
jgi:hypothetical protein